MRGATVTAMPQWPQADNLTTLLTPPTSSPGAVTPPGARPGPRGGPGRGSGGPAQPQASPAEVERQLSELRAREQRLQTEIRAREVRAGGLLGLQAIDEVESNNTGILVWDWGGIGIAMGLQAAGGSLGL